MTGSQCHVRKNVFVFMCIGVYVVSKWCVEKVKGKNEKEKEASSKEGLFESYFYFAIRLYLRR